MHKSKHLYSPFTNLSKVHSFFHSFALIDIRTVDDDDYKQRFHCCWESLRLGNIDRSDFKSLNLSPEKDARFGKIWETSDFADDFLDPFFPW